MKIHVKYGDKRKAIDIKSASTAKDVIKKMKINSETVLIRKGKEIIPHTEKLKDGDKIELLRVVSGG